MDYISNISKNLQQLIHLEIHKYRTNKLWKELTGLMRWMDVGEKTHLTGWYYMYPRNYALVKAFQFDISHRPGWNGRILVGVKFEQIGKLVPAQYKTRGNAFLPERYWYSNGTVK